MNELEGLMIYKQYLGMIYYTENITLKYPKSEKGAMVVEIKRITYNGMRKIILANKEFNKNKRIIILNEIDVELKMLKVMIRVSYKKKIYNIGNLLGGWIKSCLKV